MAAILYMGFRKLTLEELPPVIGSLVVSLFVLPLAIGRLLAGELAVAAIDFAVVLIFLGIFYLVYFKRAVRLASVLLAVFLMSASVISVNIQGSVEVAWMYPTLAGMFFLLKPKEAIAISGIGFALTYSVITESLDRTGAFVTLSTICINAAVALIFASITTAQRTQLAAVAQIDSLTGIGNRRALDEALAEQTQIARQTDRPLVLMMLDIDFFKRVNDTFGHATGDRVLCAVASTLTRNTRADDACFRAGGEEFVVLSPATTLEQARIHAERLREAIAELLFPDVVSPEPLQITASFGLAEYRLGESTDSLRGRADAALYEAKRSGRNRLYVIGRTGSLSGTGTHEVTLQINR